MLAPLTVAATGPAPFSIPSVTAEFNVLNNTLTASVTTVNDYMHALSLRRADAQAVTLIAYGPIDIVGNSWSEVTPIPPSVSITPGMHQFRLYQMMPALVEHTLTWNLEAPAISTAAGALAGGTVGVAYSQAIASTPGLNYAPLANQWTVLPGGTLPPGLNLTAGGQTGVTISGTPTTAGTFNFTLRFSGGATVPAPFYVERAFSIAIVAGGGGGVVSPSPAPVTPTPAPVTPTPPPGGNGGGTPGGTPGGGGWTPSNTPRPTPSPAPATPPPADTYYVTCCRFSAHIRTPDADIRLECIDIEFQKRLQLTCLHATLVMPTGSQQCMTLPCWWMTRKLAISLHL